MIIHLIAAARPNFMKIAPLYHALKKKAWAECFVVHTGQHYDLNMSDAFFQDLKLPEPDIHLDIGSGSHAEQTGQVMIAYEKVLFKTRPDMVIVVGDVNSTLACTLAATKLSYDPIKNSKFKIQDCGGRRPLVAHLEAGLRSFDRTMPEEINRIVTDSLADILWTPSPDADQNLLREGIPAEKIIRVGNIMIDSLEMLREKISKAAAYREFDLGPNHYGLVTLHRPSNVDDPVALGKLCQVLRLISKKIPLIFPIHPRTRRNLEKQGLLPLLLDDPQLFGIEPLGYMRFMNLIFNSSFVITDSGGIQEETSYLGIPCLTVRPNTERPITISQGTNRLCAIEELEKQAEAIISGKFADKQEIELWDGHTADRVVKSIEKLMH